MPRLTIAILSLAPCLAFSVACGSRPQPTTPTPPAGSQTPNNPPQIVFARVTPDIGFGDVTTFTAHVDATDPDGDPLGIAWSSFLSGSAILSEQRDFTFAPLPDRISSPLTVAVTDGRGGRATAQADFVSIEFQGTFDGFVGDKRQPAGFFSIVLAESGNVVTGTISDGSHLGLTDPAQPGHLDPDGHFRLRFKLESLPDLTFDGKLVRCVSAQTCPILGRQFIATGKLTGGRFDGFTFTFSDRED